MVDFYSRDNEVIFSVGLLLSSVEEQSAILISQEIAKEHDVRFTLSRESRPPFVRLYEFLLPTQNTEKALSIVEQIAGDMIPFSIDWSEVEQTNVFQAVWVHANEPLIRVQRAMILALNPLREGNIKEKYVSEHSQSFLTVEERQSLLSWGSPWVDPYLPHMVLAKAKTKFTAPVEFEWPYQHCVLRGLIYGTKKEDGEFTDLHTIEFNQSVG